MPPSLRTNITVALPFPSFSSVQLYNMFSHGSSGVGRDPGQGTASHGGVDFGLMHSITISTALVLAVGLVGWRVWNFTLLPLLRPKEIPELPYWIPCGSTSTMIKVVARDYTQHG